MKLYQLTYKTEYRPSGEIVEGKASLFANLDNARARAQTLTEPLDYSILQVDAGRSDFYLGHWQRNPQASFLADAESVAEYRIAVSIHALETED